jgi:hypothetical protein
MAIFRCSSFWLLFYVELTDMGVVYQLIYGVNRLLRTFTKSDSLLLWLHTWFNLLKPSGNFTYHQV